MVATRTYFNLARFSPVPWVFLAALLSGLASGRAEAGPSGLARSRQLSNGRDAYQNLCAGCHGIKGDGQGPAAAFLYPKPRDFVTGEYKFSSRPTPGLPTDEDLSRVIREGLRGTAMSGFHLLREEQIQSLIAYLKTLSPRWQQPQGPPIVQGADPWEGREAEGIERGRQVYHVEAVCISCHPSYLDQPAIDEMSLNLGFEPIPLREDASLSVPRETDSGSLIVPPDFRRDRIKTGPSLSNLYRVISAGITTTAMPTWSGVLDDDQLWGLAHYIQSLAGARPFRIDPSGYRLRPQIDLEPASAPAAEAEEFLGEPGS